MRLYADKIFEELLGEFEEAEKTCIYEFSLDEERDLKRLELRVKIYQKKWELAKINERVQRRQE